MRVTDFLVTFVAQLADYKAPSFEAGVGFYQGSYTPKGKTDTPKGKTDISKVRLSH